MIKRTLCFSHPAYLSLCNSQLVIHRPHNDSRPDSEDEEENITLPIEDIGVVVLDNRQISITHGLLAALLENNCAVVTCDAAHMPVGLLLPLEGNTTQSERFQDQIAASLPLRKQLWQQTVECKIHNQAAVLKAAQEIEVGNMTAWADNVKSGDSDNLEGRAAAFYWSRLFPHLPGWTRDRLGPWPNLLLNYGYAILRAVMARALVSAGLLPTLGIHHHNRYNAYCLADDIMEPYRPYVDRRVLQIMQSHPEAEEHLTPLLKQELLAIPVAEVVIGGQRSPLMVAAAQTAASLAKCYSGEQRKISYPVIPF